ncbi:MAG: hypothetical protein COZ75_10655 [Flavobacteriaceae bacterium CG_4_8_14_3_um_filter_34_10]|nr:MAG: hypothetical protein COW66_08030 [Flavobacteriaceae bacterium CG18_big_fil_WC_8_21_14_2_50_34_36]PIV48931.1 MAG: hypothetical protein COS19_11190 [Flavobacteriaceae bacterium CG02_land_8_20_14_3_00_34_13]PIX08713.1 MAG: hypothetical protein COZ75_10655 [Flavobacteriaceae bacterium CG_4_8_14_3_um_filter_34_10]PIZ08291.1 MAG: hypothetical protein COY56_04575 [Flavobacteriaceae bacterium CG_4_10_14_0_8_um_filter_34_31]PJC08509.1 MAG: hypothetical protein CO068_00680 [Flavobacteriaceae bact
MELYLIKSGFCNAILFGFYKLFLENENMHVFKRFYLLGTLLLSFLIPLITFKTYVEISGTIPSVFMDSGAISVTEIKSTTNYWSSILWVLYALGVVFFSIQFVKNLYQLISKIRNNPKFTRDSIHHVLLKTPVIPHTFLNYVFLNKQQFEAKEIPDEVIQHEHIHAKQKHSLDILVVELLQIVFWFNPLLYFIKTSIKLNHEFLADRAVLNQGTDTIAYQKLLLAFSSNATTPALANSINYSFIKKRFTVMKKQTSTKTIWLRSLLILPLLTLLVYGFSTKKIIQKEVVTEQAKTEFQQKNATKSEIQEYNTLAKKYNTMSRENIRIIRAEVGKITSIYNKMTAEQKENAEPFPHILPAQPPIPPEPPKNKEFNTTYLPKPVQSPPTPNDDPVQYIKELSNKGAVFFMGPHPYRVEEAIELAKKNKDISIDVNDYPKVKLMGC